MMKRVCKTRVGVYAMLLAVFLLVGGAGAPVFAREDMSAGQTGDPGDGLDFTSGGGIGHNEGNGVTTTRPIVPRPIRLPGVSVILVPVFDGTIMRFIVIVNCERSAENVK